MSEVVLIDLSSIAYPIWHMSQNEPDANATSTATVARVRAIATGKPSVAVCCDSGRSFRADLDANYKANRQERDATLMHQIDLVRETLTGDGFPVWAVKGFEADDLIATATAAALAAGHCVLIVSADKDLLQLVGPHVKAMSLKMGEQVGQDEVFAKFGIRPDQMRDYLTLVGDSSDNVAGVKGCGPKTAAELLGKFGTVAKLYEELKAVGSEAAGIKPAMGAALLAFEAQMPKTQALIDLRIDVPIPFAEVFLERVPPTAVEDFEMDEPKNEDIDYAFSAGPPAPKPEAATGPLVQPSQALAVREPEVLAAAPAEWERGLDPRSMEQARTLAKDMHASRLFSAYGTPQGVLSTVMVGRELGLPAMAALRSIHIVEGRHTLSAALMVALILRSGLAEYFEPISFSATEATFETKRKGARNAVRMQHTIEDAKTAGLVKPKSNWEKVPTDMLCARAQSRLARMVYPDLLAGLYTPDEMKETER